MTSSSGADSGSRADASSPQAVSTKGFDPGRIAEVVEQVEPSLLAPIIKKAADEFYNAVLNMAEDYLRDNLDWNLRSHLAMLERENRRMRTELYEVDRKLGGNMLGHASRLKSIGDLHDASCGYYQLVWEVCQKHEGETRHETALRYIKEREAASGTEAGTGETAGLGPKGDSAVPKADAQPHPLNPVCKEGGNS